MNRIIILGNNKMLFIIFLYLVGLSIKKCNDKQSKLCNDQNCDICFNRSFASYDSEKVKCWDYEKNDGISPRDVCKGSSRKFWFKCNECLHDFYTKPDHITRKGSWCHFCSHQKLCYDEKCSKCYMNSLESYDFNTIILLCHLIKKK